MLVFLGQAQATHLLMVAIKTLTREGRLLTPDVGGRATTVEVGDEIVVRMRAVEIRAPDSYTRPLTKAMQVRQATAWPASWRWNRAATSTSSLAVIWCSKCWA